MRIAVLSHDISSNALATAHLLARACRPFAEATIWGRDVGRGVWPPLAADQVPVRPLRLRDRPWFAGDAGRAAAAIAREADITIPVKPLLGSYGVARRVRRTFGTPLVLDIDDWELGFLLYGGVRWKIWADAVLHWNGIHSFFATRRLERLARQEPFRIVSNPWLRERFGGLVVPHGRDPGELDPARFDAATAKARHGVPDAPVVLFFGTPRAHKGLEDLVDAVALLPAGPLCVLAGAEAGDPYVAGLAARAPGRVRIVPQQPFSRIGEVVAMADVYVVPQRDTVAGRGQVPAKVFDAMAMARPIVATRVGALPGVLEGCARLVAPSNVAELSAAIGGLLASPAEARRLGRAARARLERAYSLEAMTERLRPLLEQAASESRGSKPEAPS